MAYVPALKKDVVNDLQDLIEKLNERGMYDLAKQAARVLQGIHSFTTIEDDDLYKGIINKSLADVWDNEKDDVYNDL